MTPTSHNTELSTRNAACRAALARGLAGRVSPKLLAAVVGGAAVIVALSVVMLRGEGEGGSGAAIKAVDRAAAEVTSFEITTTAGGELEARNRVEVRNPLEQESTIQFIIAEGANVKAGDVIVQLNADRLRTSLDEESLRLESARAELVAAENSYLIQVNDNASRLREADLKVRLAELGLAQWEEGELRKKQQELDLDINRATMELERLAQRLVMSYGLLAQGFLSKDEYDRDEVAYIEAITRFKNAHLAKQVWEEYEMVREREQKRSDVDQARAELERVRLNNDIQLADKEARRLNERRQVQIIESRVAKLQQQVQAATIRAPQDGLVVYATSLDRGGWGGREGPLQIGQQVFPNQLMMILPDTSEMVAAVRVQESLAGRVRPGQRVDVRVDAAGGKVFEGSVESIGVMAESGGWRDPNLREYIVRVALKDTQGANLKPAMRCEARVIMGVVENAVAVPVQAIFNDGPVRYVFVPKDGKYARVPVRVGRRSETLAEVSAGLSAGQSVLLVEPAAGLVVREPWNPSALQLAGYRVGDNGQIMAEMAEGRGGGRPAGAGRSGGGQPGGGRPGAEGSRPAEGAGDAQRPAGGEDTRPQRGPAAQAPDAASPGTKPGAVQPATVQATRPVEGGR